MDDEEIKKFEDWYRDNNLIIAARFALDVANNVMQGEKFEIGVTIRKSEKSNYTIKFTLYFIELNKTSHILVSKECEIYDLKENDFECELFYREVMKYIIFSKSCVYNTSDGDPKAFPGFSDLILYNQERTGENKLFKV